MSSVPDKTRTTLRSARFKWAILVAGILAVGHVVSSEYMRHQMHAFNCFDRSPAQIEKFIATQDARVPYRLPESDAGVPVTLKFNLNEAAVGEVTMFVISEKTDKLVYRGPYRATVQMLAGKDLLADNGMDNFRFLFLNPAQRRVCAWEQEGGGRLWRANASTEIEFLARREIDAATGTPVAWRVKD